MGGNCIKTNSISIPEDTHREPAMPRMPKNPQVYKRIILRVSLKRSPAATMTEDCLRQAIDKIFEDYDSDKKGYLNISQILKLLNKNAANRVVDEKEAIYFITIFNQKIVQKITKEQFYEVYKLALLDNTTDQVELAL